MGMTLNSESKRIRDEMRRVSGQWNEINRRRDLFKLYLLEEINSLKKHTENFKDGKIDFNAFKAKIENSIQLTKNIYLEAMAEKDTSVFQGEVKSAEEFIKSLESYPLVFSIAKVLYSQNVTAIEKFIELRKSFCEQLMEHLQVPLRWIRISTNEEMILKVAEHLGNNTYNYYYNKGIDLIESNTRDITLHISKFYTSLIKACLSQGI